MAKKYLIVNNIEQENKSLTTKNSYKILFYFTIFYYILMVKNIISLHQQILKKIFCATQMLFLMHFYLTRPPL